MKKAFGLSGVSIFLSEGAIFLYMLVTRARLGDTRFSGGKPDARHRRCAVVWSQRHAEVGRRASQRSAKHRLLGIAVCDQLLLVVDRKSTRLNSSHLGIS